MEKGQEENLVQRLEYNHYAIDRAYSRLKEALQSEETTDSTTGLINDMEIYAAVGEMLLWVMNASQWHKDYYKNTYKDSDILLGLRHAFNALKHNMNFIEIHKKDGGFIFNDFTFPLEFPPLIIKWGPVERVADGKRPDQEENYKQYLEGKGIIETFDTAISFLNERKKLIT